MTRQCTCGGIIRQHQLTGEREAWTCNACGKYGAIARDGTPEFVACVSQTDGSDPQPDLSLMREPQTDPR